MGQGSETSNAQIIECAVRTKDPPHDDGCCVVKARWRWRRGGESDRGRRLSCMCHRRKDGNSNGGNCKLSGKLFPLVNALRTNELLLTICKFSSTLSLSLSLSQADFKLLDELIRRISMGNNFIMSFIINPLRQQLQKCPKLRSLTGSIGH